MVGSRRWLERGAAALLLAGAAAPFWCGRYLPFLDMPQHLGLAAVVARYGDPSARFAHYYTIDPAVTPYWGYYGTMWLLSRALPLELANRVVFSAYAAGIPLASAYLLASFGRDRRWAVLTVPLVFSTNLFFGFATFLVSVPLFLLALGLSERHLARPLTPSVAPRSEAESRGRPVARLRPGLSVALAAAAALVFLCHAQTYLLLGLCALVLFAVHAGPGRGLRWAAGRSLPYLPSLLLFGSWSWRSFVGPGRGGLEQHTPHHRTYGRAGSLGAVYEPFGEVLEKMPERLLGAFTDHSDRWIGLVLATLFAASLAVAYGSCQPRAFGRAGPDPRAAPPAGEGGPAWRRWLVSRRCDLLVAVLLASYLVAPMEIYGAWYVNARYLVFAALALPLLLARPARGWRAVLVAAGAAVAVAACVNVGAKVRAFQRQVGQFEVIARELPPGGRVLGLPFDSGSRGPIRLWPFLHWACWEQILAGGDVGFSFAGLPSIPVRYREGMQAPHPSEWRPDQFDWAVMGPSYDAFLVSGQPRGRGGEELRRNAEVVAKAGPWTLWKPRSPTLSVHPERRGPRASGASESRDRASSNPTLDPRPRPRRRP